MGRMRRFGAALVMASLIGGGLGTASLQAAKKPRPGTICDYLQAVIDYEYTSPYVLVYVLYLYDYYGC